MEDDDAVSVDAPGDDRSCDVGDLRRDGERRMNAAGAETGTRRFAGWAAALAFALLGAACAETRVNGLAGPLTLPPAPAALTEYDPSAEGVEVAPLEGTAAPMAKLLARSVVEGLGRYNVPAIVTPGASPGVLPGTIPAVAPAAVAPPPSGARPALSSRFLMTGHAGPNRDPALNSVIAVEWRVFDRRENREVGRFVDGVTADRFAWDNGDPRVIHTVGESAAHGFSSLVMRTPPTVVTHGPVLSAPARVAAKPALAVAAEPRASTTAEPRASTVVASMSSDPAATPMLAVGTAEVAPSSRPYDAGSTPAPAPAPAAAGPATLLFLIPVSGAPGDGNSALTRAARVALIARGYGIADQPRSAHYLMAGSVTVGADEAGRQPVRVVWEISDAKGRALGRAVQENAVAAGSLDKSWGSMAALVAGAAVPGIADVIRRSEVADAARGAPAEFSERRLKIPPTMTLPAVPGQATLPRG